MRQVASLRLADQKVGRFWHDYVTIDADLVVLPDSFQRRFEDGAGFDRLKFWTAFVTAEGQEVELAGFVEALESPGHGERLFTTDSTCL